MVIAPLSTISPSTSAADMWRPDAVSAHRLPRMLVARLVGAVLAVGSPMVQGIVIINKNPTQLTTPLTWLSGSTYARGWNQPAQSLPWMLVLLPLSWLTARWPALFALGQDAPAVSAWR